MRTLGLMIKTTAMILCCIVGTVAVFTGINWLAASSMVAMFLIFLIQSVEMFLSKGAK